MENDEFLKELFSRESIKVALNIAILFTLLVLAYNEGQAVALAYHEMCSACLYTQNITDALNKTVNLNISGGVKMKYDENGRDD